MAAPSVSSVAPSPIWTGGQFVSITGTNFRVAPIPSYPLDGAYPAPLPSVQVTIGGTVLDPSKVRQRSTTLIECLAPANDPGAADVTVQNLDDDGAPIPGETATLVAAVTYARPDLTSQPDVDRVNRQIIRDLKRQIIPNVVLSVSVDDGESPFGFTTLGKLPAITLAGPDIQEDRPFYSSNEAIETGGTPDLTFTKLKPFKSYSLTYGISVIANNQGQFIALWALVLQFFERNTKLVIARDPNDSTKGNIEFRMHVPIESSWKSTTTPNSNDIKTLTNQFMIRGVSLEELASFPGEGIAEKGDTLETLTLRPSTGF